MSYDQYLITTFMNAGSKILPIVVSLIVGYLVFVKLPFWFFRQTLKDVRKMHPEEDNLPKFPEEAKVMRLEDKIRRDAEELKKENQKKEQPKKEQPKKEQKKEGPKKEEKKEVPKRPAAEAGPSPESIFELIPGQKLSSTELKSRYYELLKQSHPDRVASMGPEFRKLAEKKTKEINEAYSRLRKKAS